MNPEIIHDALNNIDNDIIDSVAKLRFSKISAKKRKTKRRTIAACFTLVISIGILLICNQNAGLTKLTVSDISEAYGCEEYFVRNIMDFVSGNPWNENSEVGNLPVFKSQYRLSEENSINGNIIKQMKKRLKEIAGHFQLDESSLTAEQDIMYIRGSLYTAEIDNTMTVRIKANIELPKDYKIYEGASYDELKKTGDYIIKKYSGLLKMKNPTISIDGGDYDVDGKNQFYSVSFFDSTDDCKNNIISHAFNSVLLTNKEDGNAVLNWVFKDLSCIVGDYPIINVSEAYELLKNGNYITSVTQAFPQNGYIGRTELVYRQELNDKFYMPYYKFYVEISSNDSELETYGIYYVPAVEGRYIENMPLWDGSIN